MTAMTAMTAVTAVTAVPAASPALRLWGTPELAGEPPLRFAAERRFQLLALLALAGGQWVERDRAAALLWPEAEMATARRNLRKVLFMAHALVGEGAIEAGAEALRWPVDTDVAAFEAARRQDPAAALAWRRGVPLQGLDDPRNTAWSAWLAGERARLDQAWLATAHAHLQAQATPDARIDVARQLLAVDPLDEPAVAALMRAEIAAGRPAQAQAEYRRYAAALAQELGVEPSHALRDLLLPAAPPAAAPALPATGDPESDEGFIGRRTELAELQALLANPACRLVTVLGPGGIGKSSLARQAQRRLSPLFPAGAAWVPLHDAQAAAELPARVAQALGVPLGDAKDPLRELLAGWLGTSRGLLVLDNTEHLADLAPPLQALLTALPGLVLLLTSRTRLPLADEWVLPLQGLAVPDEDSRDLEAAASFDAVRLFERRAQAARRSFTLAAHLPAVLTVCDALGGLPLAIELAASWVRLLPPETIADDLAQEAAPALDLLERDPATPGTLARAEHASLRAVLQGSWRLLGAREQQALAALAVFQGGFTRAAAQAVTGTPLPLLSALVDASLLAADADTGRFAMHPVVQRFATERQVEDASRAAALHDAHAAHFSRLAAAQAAHASGNQRELIRALGPEHTNLRVAWGHALARQQPGLLLDMARPWRIYLEISGRLAEGLQLFRAALAQPDGSVDARRLLARVRHAACALHYRRGEPVEALALAQAGAQAAEALGDRETLLGCLNLQGLAQWHRGHPSEALAPLAQALALAEQDGNREAQGAILTSLAIAHKALGRFDEALVGNERALAIARELGNQRSVSFQLNNIGNLHRALAQWRQARTWFAEGVRHAREFGLVATLQYVEVNLALVDIELGELETARSVLLGLVERQREVSQLLIEVAAELGLARIDLRQGRLAEARQRLPGALRRARGSANDALAVQVMLVHAEVLLGEGRRAEAAACWQTLCAEPAAEAADRMTARRQLQALGEADAPPPGVALRPLEHWIAQLGRVA